MGMPGGAARVLRMQYATAAVSKAVRCCTEAVQYGLLAAHCSMEVVIGSFVGWLQFPIAAARQFVWSPTCDSTGLCQHLWIELCSLSSSAGLPLCCAVTVEPTLTGLLSLGFCHLVIDSLCYLIQPILATFKTTHSCVDSSACRCIVIHCVTHGWPAPADWEKRVLGWLAPADSQHLY